MRQLSQGLRKRQNGRILLWGAPGTGKTQYVQQFAKSIDKPLIEKRASDILNPYVGMTEKNMAEIFSQASEQEVILLIDEVEALEKESQIKGTEKKPMGFGR